MLNSVVKNQIFCELCEPFVFVWCNWNIICIKAPLCNYWSDFWMSYIGLKNCSLKNVLTLKKDTGPGFLGTLQPVEICNFALPLEMMSFQYLCAVDKTRFWWRQLLLQFILRCTLRFFTSVKLRCCEVSAHGFLFVCRMILHSDTQK